MCDGAQIRFLVGIDVKRQIFPLRKEGQGTFYSAIFQNGDVFDKDTAGKRLVRRKIHPLIMAFLDRKDADEQKDAKTQQRPVDLLQKSRDKKGEKQENSR